MSKRELTRTIDVTKYNNDEIEIGSAILDKAVAKAKERMGELYIDRKVREERNKQREANLETAKEKTKKISEDRAATRAQDKLLAESVALRRQASFTGASPEAVKEAAEKKLAIKEALAREEQKEQEVTEKHKKDHPERYDKDGKLIIDENDGEYSSPDTFVEEEPVKEEDIDMENYKDETTDEQIKELWPDK